MKKTVALIIALCLVVLAFVPSVSVRASFDGSYHIKTVQSVDGFWSDSQINTWQKNIVGLGSNVSGFLDSNKISLIYDALDSLVIENGYEPFLVYIDQSGNLYCIVCSSDFIEDACAIIMRDSMPDIGIPQLRLLVKGKNISSGYKFLFGHYQTSLSNNSFNWSSLSLNKGYVAPGDLYESDYFSNILGIIDGGDYPLYLNADIISQGNSAFSYNYDSSVASFLSRDRSSYTNFMSGNLPYSNSSGFIVDPNEPTEPEVNTALAFDVFNSQVVYNQFNKTFTSANISWDLNPMGRTILETYPATEWDMKFTCQVTYNMNSYRPNNQTTPLQSYANGFTFTGTYSFDDYDSIMDGQIYGIDPIKGFETLSDAEIASAVNPDCNLFFALLGAMKGNYASGNSYTSGKTGFSLVGGTLVRFFADNYVSAGGLGSAVLQLEALTGQNGRDWLEDHISGDYIYMLDNFTMNVQAWFECGSVKSQSGYTDIDFVNHTTSSYAPKAYETEEGVTPIIPDPYTNTNDTPVEPGGLDANGVVVYVPVNVEVNVPSGGGDNTVTSGDNSIINNNNPTFNPVFNNNNENSVESLSDLIGEDAATANNGIGGFLDPFKNNAMVTLTGEYLGIIPDQLKTLLTAAVGILIVLGIYRFIRRG